MDDDDAQPSTPSRGQGSSTSNRNSRRDRPQGTRSSATTPNATGSTLRTPRRATAPRARARAAPAPLNIDSSRENTPGDVTPPFSPLRGRQSARTRFNSGHRPSPPSPRSQMPEHFPSEDSDVDFPVEPTGRVVHGKYVSPVKEAKNKRKKKRRIRPPKPNDIIEISDSDDEQPSPSRPPPRKKRRLAPPRLSSEVIVITNTSDEEANERPAPATRAPTLPPFPDVEDVAMGGAEDIGDMFDGAEDDPAETPWDDVFVDNGQHDIGNPVQAQSPVPGGVDVRLMASAAEVEEGPATKEQYEAALIFDRELGNIAEPNVPVPASPTRPTASLTLLQGPGIPSSPLPDVVPAPSLPSPSPPSPPAAPAPSLPSPTSRQPSTNPNSTPGPSKSGEIVIERPVASASTRSLPTPIISASAAQQPSKSLGLSSMSLPPTPAPARLDAATTTQSVPTPAISVVSSPPIATSPPLTNTPVSSVASASTTGPTTFAPRRSLLPPSNSNLVRPIPTPPRGPTPARPTAGSHTQSAPLRPLSAIGIFGSSNDVLAHRRQPRPPPRPSTSLSYWDGANPSNRRNPSRPKSAGKAQAQDKVPAGSNPNNSAFGYTPPPLSPRSDSTLGGTPPMNNLVPLAVTCVTNEEGTVVKRVDVANRTSEEVDELADDSDLDLDLLYPPSP
ncbi:hypothetical protein B0H16DRAFT_282453 [Mycena metata]|uniref:Uncharacterized protein n=1 Tax=Mycena metata TaxID=1033252 RepID=A0AAD7HPM2_9AGAR|nr:hypothetical protein B0H16DRAFT_282453 [Mycena metata]